MEILIFIGLQEGDILAHNRVTDKQLVTHSGVWQPKMSPSCKPMKMQDFMQIYIKYNKMEYRCEKSNREKQINDSYTVNYIYFTL